MDQTQQEYTLKEIIDSACGRDETGYTRSSVGLFYFNVHEDGKDEEIIQTVGCDKPVVSITKRYDYIFIDLIFSTHLDTDLAQMNSLLKDAFAASDSFDTNRKTFPLITLSIVPHEFAGTYYLICKDPAFWALTAQEPDGELHTLRFVFDEEDFFLMAADDGVLEQMMEEAAAEYEAQDKRDEFYRTKEAERRNARILEPALLP